MFTNDLRGTLQQSSMQQQLQQHPSGEAAAVLIRLTWALSKSFSWGTWHKCISYAPRVARQPLFDQLGDRPSSLVREGLVVTPVEPRVMSARMPLQGE